MPLRISTTKVSPPFIADDQKINNKREREDPSNINIVSNKTHKTAHKSHSSTSTPLFTGGFTYDRPLHYLDSLIHRQLGAQTDLALHGVHIDAVNGHGLDVDPNNEVYNCGGFFQHNMVRNPEAAYGPNAVKSTTTDMYGCIRGGWCAGCGFHIINPNRPNDIVKYVPCIPETNIPNYRNYYHYSCYHSDFRDYNHCRYNAAASLNVPALVMWGCSQNNGLQDLGPNSNNIRSTWQFIESADLVIGMHLSGQTHADPKNYRRVLSFCPILRCTNKTVAQIRKKWTTLVLRRDQYINMPLVQFDQMPIPP